MAEQNSGWFQIGNDGRAKKWQTPEELQKDIDAYFQECDNNVISVKDGKPITEPYTIEGLAIALDCTYQTLNNYEKAKGYEPFFSTIKKAKLRVQKQKVVNGLVGLSNPTITIFDLKNNHGYKDKQEVDQTNRTVEPTQYVIVNDRNTNTSS